MAESDDRDVIAFDGLNGDDYVYTDIFDLPPCTTLEAEADDPAGRACR